LYFRNGGEGRKPGYNDSGSACNDTSRLHLYVIHYYDATAHFVELRFRGREQDGGEWRS